MEKTLEQKRFDREQLIKQTILTFEQYVFPKYIDNYKVYLWFVLDRISEIEPWQSNVDYPLVSSIVDTMFASLYDSAYKFNIDDEALRRACNRAYDFRQTGKRTLSPVTKEALICWKAFARDFLLKERRKENFSHIWVEVDVDVKTPTMEYISVFDVFYDRSTWLTKSPFKIIRTFITWEEIKTKARMLWAGKVLKKPMDEAEKDKVHKNIDSLIDKVLTTAKDKNQKPFSPYNCNTVKDLSNASPLLINKMRTESNIARGYTSLPLRNVENERDLNNFFLNKDSTSYEFVVYTTCDEVAYYVNWVLLFEGPRVHNVWEIREITNSEIPGTGNSNGEADKVWGLQYILNGLWNAFLDNTKMSLSDMYEVMWNSPFVRNGKIQFQKFGALKVNQANSIRRLEMGVKDFAPLNYIQIMTEFGQQRSGVNQYLLGGQWRAERVSGWVDLILNQYKSKLTPITDSINMMMSNIARSWILMFLKYYTADELAKKDIAIEKIFDDKWKAVSFTVNGKDVKDIIDEDNISFSFDALYKVELENKRAALKENLQYLLQYAIQQINLPELMKAILGMDFDIEKVFKDPAFKEWFTSEKIEEVIPEETVVQPEEVGIDEAWSELTDEDLQSLDQLI